MRVLIDTHVVLWWFFNDNRLSADAFATIANPKTEILVSSASAWEVATKSRIGKLPEAGPIAQNFPALMRRARFSELPVTIEHGLAAGSLPGVHRDPFDRILAAQARLEALPLVTIDPVFATFELTIIW